MSELNPADSPGARPHHTAHAEAAPTPWRVSVGDVEVASSQNVLLVMEHYGGRDLDPVPYFPPDDVDQGLLTGTDHETTCPVKGAASYYSVDADGETLKNAAWYYPEPDDNLTDVAGYIAFYPDRFVIEQI